MIGPAYKPNQRIVNLLRISLMPLLLLFACVIDAPPTADDQSLSTSEDTSLAITLTGSDAEGNDLSFAVMREPSNGALTGAAPRLTYTPDLDYVGSDAFTFKTNDGVMDSAEATISIAISGVNDPPVANDQAHATPVNTPLDVTVTCTDVDGDALTYTVVGGPDHGALTGVAPYLMYTPDMHYEGVDAFTFKANDGTVDSAVATVIIEVGQNDPPTGLSLDSISIPEDQPAGTTIGVLSTTDPDLADTHTYSLVAGAGDEDNADFSIRGDRLLSAVQFDFEAKNTYSVRVRTTDSEGNTFEKAFTIAVTDENVPPTLVSPDDQVVIRNTLTPNSVSVTFDVSDQDGDVVTVTATSSDQAVVADADLDLSCVAGVCTLEFMPDPTSNSVTTMTLSATDGVEIVNDTFDVNVTSRLVMSVNDSGAGSLRQIVQDAIAGDVIGFDAGRAFATPQTITLTSGQLVLDRALELEGTGDEHLTISGGNADRVLRIDAEVVVSDLSISNGWTPESHDGGGILVAQDGHLTLIDSTVASNSSGNRGGGIYAEFGTVVLVRSTVINNVSNGDGGGLYIELGRLDVDGESIITHNTADANSNGSGNGGGLFNHFGDMTGADPSTVLVNSPDDVMTCTSDRLSPVWTSYQEPNLDGAGQILDTVYGLENVRRIGDDLDEVWQNLDGSVSAIATFGAVSSFGYFDDTNTYHALMTVSGYEYDVSGSASLPPTGTLPSLRWGYDVFGTVWSSAADANVDQEDHATTWQIIGGASAGGYVIGWEDLDGLQDRDYQDLVIEVRNVSIPSSCSSN